MIRYKWSGVHGMKPADEGRFVEYEEAQRIVNQHIVDTNARKTIAECAQKAYQDLMDQYMEIKGQMAKLQWQPITTAPKDQPIEAWCVHEADPYFRENGNLTLYGAHVEGLSHVEDGAHVLVWGGSWDDRSYEEPNGGWLPDWWFLSGSEFEIAANPILWRPIPAPDSLPPSPSEAKGDIPPHCKNCECPPEAEEVIEYPLDFALNLARLWRAGKMIGGDQDAVIQALLTAYEAKGDTP